MTKEDYVIKGVVSELLPFIANLRDRLTVLESTNSEDLTIRINQIAHGETELAKRVELLERQMAATQDRYERDMNILLRDALTKENPANNPFNNI